MITLENVSLRYARNDPCALPDVDLDVTRGEFCFVVGPSGPATAPCCGSSSSSTSRRCGACSSRATTSGSLPRRRIHLLRRQIGTVRQDFRLLSGKTVHQNVAYVLQMLGAGRHTRV